MTRLSLLMLVSVPVQAIAALAVPHVLHRALHPHFVPSSSPRAATLRGCSEGFIRSWRRWSSSRLRDEQQRLEDVYEAVKRGKCTTFEEEDQIVAVGGALAATYGEITSKGFRQLAARLRLCEFDRFADLGSGLGQCVIQSVCEFGVEAAVGVELAPSRHRRAQFARDVLPESQAQSVQLIEGDCASEELWHGPDAPLSDATVVWVCSTCFGPELMERIAARLSAAGSVRAVASLRPFATGQLLGFVEAAPPEPCEMSWNAAAKRAFISRGTPPEEAAFYDKREEQRNEQDAEQVFIYERIAPPPVDY